MDAITDVPLPVNEPVHEYAPHSAERTRLTEALDALTADAIDLPHVIGGDHRMGSGERIDVVQPHRHAAVLGTLTNAEHSDATAAVEAAIAAKADWEATPFDERAAVFLRAADLLAGPWRGKLAAATMLGQSKTAYQAEIDAACEMIDFWRFNVAFARQVFAQQPISGPGVWNRTDYRPLEGFVYAVTPFNFTAIGGNLPTAPALMGNTVVWKPSITQTFSAYLTMQLLEAAGLPPGVINLVTGDGYAVSDVVLADPRLAGIHFTGSTPTFQHLWREVGTNIDRYRTYPRLVGETGGKDFVLAHPSARPDVLRTAMIRGAFDYQGQKCSAASRAFVPRSVWQAMGDDFLAATEALTYGDVTDLSNYGGAVIDERAFAKHVKAIERAKGAAHVTIAAGGEYDDSEGYFVRPTVLLSDDPTDEAFSTEYFGPDPRGARLRRRQLVRHPRRHRQWLPVRADRRGDRRRPVRRVGRPKPVAPCCGQLLRQRQAHWRGRRPAAVRRIARIRHQRQGRVHAEPVALGVAALDQGDVRPGHRARIPAHGGSVMPGIFGKVVRPAILAASRSDGLRHTAERLPVTRDVVHRFVPGETVADALTSVAVLRDSGRLVSIDYLGEDVTDGEAATATVRAYLALLDALAARTEPSAEPRPLEVSLKLSALGQALPRDGEKIALENAHAICTKARDVGAWVTVDAEDHTTTDSTLSIVRDLRADFDWLGTVLQAYLLRTEADCAEFAASGARIRLCKGAYDEPASVAFRDRAAVTDSYLRCLRVLMAGRGLSDGGVPRSGDHRGRAGTGRRIRPRGRRFRVPDVVRNPRRRAATPGRTRATTSGCTCRSARSGTATSSDGWPSGRPT